ncbi:MAG: hypothetical protein IPJ19_13765 [Planctomycetes bacterium]|nr:hypothetical protein [Planctomycetota bacterium]
MNPNLSRLTPLVSSTLGTAAALLLVAASASALGNWTGVTVLEPSMLSSGPPEAPIVDSDAVGHAVCVWTSPSMGVVFTERYPGATWSNPMTVPTALDGFSPQVAIGANGLVAVTWVTPGQEFNPPKLMASVRPAGGAFLAPKQLVSGVYVFDAKVDVCASGSVTVVWSQSNRIQSALRTSAGQWSPVRALSPLGLTSRLPDLAVNDAGAALVVWQETLAGGTGPGAIAAAYRPAPARSEFGVSQVVSAGTGAQTWSPKALIDADGDAAVGYLDGNHLVLAEKPYGSRWDLPQQISPMGDSVYSCALAMDADGDVIAAWQSLDPSNYGTVSKRTLPAFAPWGPVTVLSSGLQDASYPSAAIAADGSIASVTWTDNNTFAAHAALGRLRGAWTVDTIGTCWWNTQMPVAAGSGAVSVVWPMPTANPNVTKMVANAYTP